MKRLLLAILILLPLAGMAKPTYKISLKIDGNNDSMMLLCFYYAQSERIMDTAYNDGKGNFLFEGNDTLHPGLYFFTNNRNRYVEFVVYHEKPNFKFHTDDRSWMMNMKVKGSRQNEIFYNYQRASESLYREIEDHKSQLDSAALAEFTATQHLRIDSLKMDFITRYPEAMISKMMASTKDIDVPTEKEDGSKMTPRERYDYVMDHYFDNMPLDDDFLIRTPKAVFYQRVIDYIEKYMRNWPPEMICPKLDVLIDRAEPAEEVQKWLIYKLTDYYLQSNVMVYDEVYVHIVQRYFATGKAPWFSPSMIDEQIERANKWEHLLVGRESPELILFDTNHYAYSLHRMKGDYTILIFWSPTCGHCREIIPAVYKVFEEYQDSLNMTAFAILSEPDEATIVKWKKFLADHKMTSHKWVNLNGGEANVDWREVYDITTTPQIYMIENKNHTFIAKKLNAQILREICKSLTKQSQQ
ncbi:MAG: DUF5106 domain-containing protein [Bacteroidales bacterium]|nr:DUF5106 domain-containing protein [Bacteroidales bacterium]